ncbi:MAG: hypothetical protein Q8P67_24910, partial [archaeon]|nr:hypothetical protein [archaeon]
SFIFMTKRIWISHTTLVVLGASFLTMARVCILQIPKVYVATFVLGFFFIFGFQVTVFLTINSSPSKPQELDDYSGSISTTTATPERPSTDLVDTDETSSLLTSSDW